MIIPLSYYFLENDCVADEKLSYEQIISVDQLPRGSYEAPNAERYLSATSISIFFGTAAGGSRNQVFSWRKRYREDTTRVHIVLPGRYRNR
jgi:hypothetical protein